MAGRGLFPCLMLVTLVSAWPGAAATHDGQVRLGYPPEEWDGGEQMLAELEARLHGPVVKGIHFDQMADYSVETDNERRVRFDVTRHNGTTDIYTLPTTRLDRYRATVDLERIEPLAITGSADLALFLFVPLAHFYADVPPPLDEDTTGSSLREMGTHMLQALGVPLPDHPAWQADRNHTNCDFDHMVPAYMESLDDGLPYPIGLSTGMDHTTTRIRYDSGRPRETWPTSDDTKVPTDEGTSPIRETRFVNEGLQTCHGITLDRDDVAGGNVGHASIRFHLDRPWVTASIGYWANWDPDALVGKDHAGAALMRDPSVPLPGGFLHRSPWTSFDGTVRHPAYHWYIAAIPDLGDGQPCESSGYVEFTQDAITLDYLRTRQDHSWQERCAPTKDAAWGAHGALVALGVGVSVLGFILLKGSRFGYELAWAPLVLVGAVLIAPSLAEDVSMPRAESVLADHVTEPGTGPRASAVEVLARFGVQDASFLHEERIDRYRTQMQRLEYSGTDAYGIERRWMITQDAATHEVVHVGAEPDLYPMYDAREAGPGVVWATSIVGTIGWLLTRKWSRT